jgi:ketol-acid reductoisomerase
MAPLPETGLRRTRKDVPDFTAMRKEAQESLVEKTGKELREKHELEA